jgi:hypothetical protein
MAKLQKFLQTAKETAENEGKQKTGSPVCSEKKKNWQLRGGKKAHNHVKKR